MLLFVNPSGIAYKLVIPLERVFDISGYGCSIIINYDSGEMVEVVDGVYQKKIESARIVFDSEDTVNKIFRQFYKACNSGAGAFFFGDKEG